MIPIYKPYLPKHILKYAHDAIDSTWISSHGKYIELATNKLQELLGCEYIILTNNGTTATHLMSIGLNYKYPNIETINVPNNVYIAAWNSFRMSNNYKFNVLDCDIDTWNPNYDNFKCDEQQAILFVHNIGNIINVPQLKSKLNNHILLEDNCEGFLGKYDNKYSGTESWMSSISFFGNKTITAGEGGALLTNDEEMYNYLSSVRSQGYTTEKYIFDKIGYNYRMTNIQASLLYGQLEYMNEILELKENVWNTYHKYLDGVNGISFQKIEKNTNHSHWLVGIRFDNLTLEKKKELELHLYQNDIESRPMFPPITYHKHYENEKCDIKNAKKIYETSLLLPSYPELTEIEIKKICHIIKKYIN